MKTLEKKIYNYLHANHSTPCDKMAKELMDLIDADKKEVLDMLLKESANNYDFDKNAKNWSHT